MENFAHLRPYRRLPAAAQVALDNAWKFFESRDRWPTFEELRWETQGDDRLLVDLADHWRLLAHDPGGVRPTLVGLLYVEEAAGVLREVDLVLRHFAATYAPGAPPLRRSDLLDALRATHHVPPTAFRGSRLSPFFSEVGLSFSRPGDDPDDFSITRTAPTNKTLDDAFANLWIARHRADHGRLDEHGLFDLRVRAIRVRGYRAHRDAALTLSPTGLTVLVGTNAAGKSTLLDAFAFVATSVNPRRGLEHALAAEGGLERARTRDTEGPMSFEVEWDLDPGDGTRRVGRYGFELARGPFQRRMTHVVERERCEVESSGTIQTLVDGSRGVVRLALADGSLHERFRAPSDLSLGTLEEGHPLVPEICAGLASIVLLDRDPTFPAVSSERDVVERVLLTGRRRVAPSLRPLLNDVLLDPRLLARLDTIVREFVPNVERVDASVIRPDLARLEVFEKDARTASLFDELSAGTRQMLLLAAVYVHPDPPRLLLVEEPDAALHPAALGKLVDLLRSIARRSVVVATTHSPAFVARLDPHTEVLAVGRGRERTRIEPLSEVAARDPWWAEFDGARKALR